MKEIIIWSAYLDAGKSRKEGRKIPKELCINSPKIKDLYNSLKKLGYDAEIVKNKCYPKEWWEVVGYIKVKVNEDISKLEVIKKICENLKK
jgi:signal recognition particle subunit SRP19